MNIIELNHIDLNSIGLDSKQISGISKSYKHEVKPYIKGHITNGDSTFTFKINNTDITVPVDSNGNWKWVVDRNITSLVLFCYQKENIDNIIINDKLENVTSMASAFTGCLNLECITLKKGTLLNECVTIQNAFQSCPKLMDIINLGYVELKKCNNISMAFDSYYAQEQAINIDLHNAVFAPLTNAAFFARINKCTTIKMNKATFADNCNCTAMIYSNSNLISVELDNATIKGTVNYLFASCNKLENLSIGSIGVDLTFNSNPKLTEQSVVNIFNAVAANNLTLTFNYRTGGMIDAQLEIEDSPIYTAYWNKYDEGIEINYTY